MTAIIQSKRVDLIPMTPAVLLALLAGNLSEAAQLLGLSRPPDWDIHRDAMEVHQDLAE